MKNSTLQYVSAEIAAFEAQMKRSKLNLKMIKQDYNKRKKKG